MRQCGAVGSTTSEANRAQARFRRRHGAGPVIVVVGTFSRLRGWGVGGDWGSILVRSGPEDWAVLQQQTRTAVLPMRAAHTHIEVVVGRRVEFERTLPDRDLCVDYVLVYKPPKRSAQSGTFVLDVLT